MLPVFLGELGQRSLARGDGGGGPASGRCLLPSCGGAIAAHTLSCSTAPVLQHSSLIVALVGASVFASLAAGLAPGREVARAVAVLRAHAKATRVS